MATKSGRNASIKVGTYTVAEQGTWTLTMTRDEIDTTAFGSTWGKSDVGFGRWTMTFSGFADPTDTNGQVVLETGFINGTLLTTVYLYIDSTSYWTPDLTTDSDAGGRVTNYAITQDKANVATVSFTMSGSGPVTFV